MTECVHCGGSGVLNIEMSCEVTGLFIGPVEYGPISYEPYASACHCETGRMWSELGLD